MGLEMCPFLTWDETKAVCSIYGTPDLEAWNKTPCGSYQAHYDDDPLSNARPCKMGYWIHEKGGLLRFIQDRPDICRCVTRTIEALNEAHPRISDQPNRRLYTKRVPSLQRLDDIQAELAAIRLRIKEQIK
jgi:hypothetical protein